jgi:hypothetical protein
MILDEKTCWNLTWIVMDNVAWAIGVFFQAYLKEVSLMKIVRAHRFQNNESLIYDILLMYIFLEI